MDHDVSLGMSTESRYNSNLKVLRRRDPSIAAIFDQFAHVALYNHDGTRWERSGYEGSMFVFERTAYPPYGIFILNRTGPTDYIQLIYPEDDVFSASKELSVIRSYPTFLADRIKNLEATYTTLPADPFHPAYLVPGIDKVDQKSKGPSSAVGLWVLRNPSRDDLIDVLQRLQKSIRENLPYPVEHRYGPGRPPPSHRLRVKRREMDPDASDSQYASQSESETDASRHYDQQQAPPIPAPVLASNPAIDALFKSALAHSSASVSSSPAPTSTTPAPPQTPGQTGMQLLGAIFASAQASPSPALPHSRPQSTASSYTSHHHPQQPQTYPSQQPSYPSSHSHQQQQQPRVLDNTVLSTLLGLVHNNGTTHNNPPRCASAASASSGGHSHPSSREGDDEDERDSSVGGYGTDDGRTQGSFHVLKEDSGSERDENVRVRDTLSGLLGIPSSNAGSSSSTSSNGYGNRPVKHKTGVNGDVTPRPPLSSSLSSSTATVTAHPPRGGANTNGRQQHHAHAPGPIQSVSSIATVRASGHGRTESGSSTSSTPPPQGNPTANANGKAKPRQGRALVPFEPDSELWPYSNNAAAVSSSPASGSEKNIGTGGSQGMESGDEVVVELDFSEMSVLSDMDAFDRLKGAGGGQRQGQGQPKEKEKMSRRERGAAKKREREAKEREAIEKSWDIPGKPQQQSHVQQPHVQPQPQPQQRSLLPPGPPPGPPASPSPPPGPSTRHLQPLNQGPLPPTASSSASTNLLKTPTMNVRHLTNGNGHANGETQAPVKKQDGLVDKEVVKGCLLGGVEGKMQNQTKKMEKREFVMEVLKLIHSDAAFTESLYQEYLSRSG